MNQQVWTKNGWSIASIGHVRGMVSSDDTNLVAGGHQVGVDLARRLDNQPAAAVRCKGRVPSPTGSASGLSPDGHRMLRAIDELPEDEREVFDLGRIQGMMQAEATQAFGVSAVTVRRRLSRGLRLLREQLA
jgi:predicted DNA-binding protein (UPF0251 family)